MPDTLDAALDKLAKDYSMALPVADLLYSDIFARMTAGVTGEMNLGPTNIDGQSCNHLAFTAQGVNWEIWIQQGDKPLPRKILINYIDQPESPQYVMEISQWQAQAPPATAFDVSIPSDLKKIDILPTSAQPMAEK